MILGAAVGAAAPGDEKAGVDRRLERTEERLQRERGREGVLTDQVQGYTDRIRILESRLRPLQAHSARLEAELAALRDRLEQLSGRLAIERARLARAESALAEQRLALGRRLRDIYVRGEPDPVLTLLQSGSLAAAIATSELLETIADRDAGLARSIKRYADESRRTRDAIAAARAEVAASEARAAEAAAEARLAKAGLERERSKVARVLQGRSDLLASVRGDRRQLEAEARDLARRSAALGERIRRAQGATAPPGGTVAVGTPSSAGLSWPVSGPITSGYGPRWGRMHEGIDIAGSSGTPIVASASGTVVLAGWSGGYGNLVVVDHGNGLSTAYAHNSSIAVSVGQSVGRGTALAGMGTTGNSTGVHSHFEVRVSGAAVDPLGYL